MRNIFTPEDFKATEKTEGFGFDTNQGQRNAFFAAEKANEILNKLIESWPVVYGFVNKEGVDFGSSLINKGHPFFTASTHTARLAFIEEIKPKCEKHEPFNINEGIILPSYPAQVPEPIWKCARCGVELIAEWRAKE